MCEALRRLMKEDLEAAEYRGRLEGEAKGKAEGILEGEAKGRINGKLEGKIEAIKSLMRTMNFTAEQAMRALQIPASDFAKYLQVL